MNNLSLSKIIRALRLPFTTASALPFIAGSFIFKEIFEFVPFSLGLMTAVLTHLGANLINDYADSKYGTDWQDRNFYNFFGGSKLIQEGSLPLNFYLYLAVAFFAISFLSILTLAFLFKNVSIIGYYILIMFLGFSYSHKPLALSYRRMGEVIIFLLFGPAVLMGGYFIQTHIFPDLRSFMLSLPFGLFTTAILFSNEIPDRQTDMKSNKFTWASVVSSSRGFIIYLVIILLGYLSIILNIIMGYLSWVSCFALIFLILSLKAANILKRYHDDKLMLVNSSKLTIAVQSLVGLVIILDLLL
ncbi:MAG: prenyltransferase [Candidatus Omnitrophica bacterium]|nr:prenyltransferase [Candidatus Omnitrophota bacterium]HOX55103.1 prenyltransferase [Candidatus Omnitrophota bacterium]